MKNLAECQTTTHIMNWLLGQDKGDARLRMNYSANIQEALHQAALIGARIGIEAAAKACEAERLEDPQDETDASYDMATNDCVDAVRALDAAAIVKKGM